MTQVEKLMIRLKEVEKVYLSLPGHDSYLQSVL